MWKYRNLGAKKTAWARLRRIFFGLAVVFNSTYNSTQQGLELEQENHRVLSMEREMMPHLARRVHLWSFCYLNEEEKFTGRWKLSSPFFPKWLTHVRLTNWDFLFLILDKNLYKLYFLFYTLVKHESWHCSEVLHRSSISSLSLVSAMAFSMSGMIILC